MNRSTHTAGKGGLPCALGVVAIVVVVVCSGCGPMYSTAPAFRPFYRTAPHSPRVGRERPHAAVASWYGPGFAGHRTSSGERYDPNSLTAASRTLPIGSVVRVTNPDNGRSVDVRINDRGPFVRGRSLDLSKRAAERIGIKRKGVARVRVTRVRRSHYWESASTM